MKWLPQWMLEKRRDLPMKWMPQWTKLRPTTKSAQGGFTSTSETRGKISAATKGKSIGKTPWIKGKEHSEEARDQAKE